MSQKQKAWDGLKYLLALGVLCLAVWIWNKGLGPEFKKAFSSSTAFPVEDSRLR